MDRETIARCFMNILDVHHYYDYVIFMNNDLYEQLKNYITHITDDEQGIIDYNKILEKNKNIINMIANNKPISNDDYNKVMEDLREFRKKYIQKK